MADKYDFSDSNTTFLPESARGSLRDRIASQTDANMGRRRVYLNNEEWQEYQAFKNNKMFDRMISDMQPEDQDIFKEMYGRGEYISPDEPRSYDDIKWKKGSYAAEGEIRFANGYKLMVCKVPEEEGIKVLSVVNRKTLEELPLDVIRGVSEAGFKPQHNYSVEQIEQLISLVQKVKGSYYPQEQEKLTEKGGIQPLMPNHANASFIKPNFYNKIEDIDLLKPNDLLKINNLSTSAEERTKNESLVQQYNNKNKVENDTADFSKLKWGRELTLAPIQAKDGSTTYVCSETTQIPLENGNTISIVKKENGTYSYLTLDKDNNVISSSHNMKEEDVANMLKLETNNLKKKQENISEDNHSHTPYTYRDVDNIEHLGLNDRLTIAQSFVSDEQEEHNRASINKYNEEHKVENSTANFDELKWGTKLVVDTDIPDRNTITYVCVESADIPLVGGFSINITKKGNGFVYSLLDNEKESLSSFYTEDKQALADKLKANGHLIPDKTEYHDIEDAEIVEEIPEPKEIDLSKDIDVTDSMQRIDAMVQQAQQEFKNGLKKLDSQFPNANQYLERIKRRQQEFMTEKGESSSALPDDDSKKKKHSKTSISKETMNAYMAQNLKQNQ